MFKPCPSRWFYFSEFLVVSGLLAFGFYLEWYQNVLPCPLCELQRVVYAVLGVLFLLSTLIRWQRWGQVVMNVFMLLVSLLGVLLAGWHVWLQHAPAGSILPGSCEGSIRYMLQVMPISNVLGNILLGGPECAKVTWQFLHLSIAEWSLLCFLGFFVAAFWQGLGFILKR